MNSPLTSFLIIAAALQTLDRSPESLSGSAFQVARRSCPDAVATCGKCFRFTPGSSPSRWPSSPLWTWRFADLMAGHSDPVCQWLAAGIGVFWAIRAVLQVDVLQQPAIGVTSLGGLLRTLDCSSSMGGFAAIYLWAAFGPVSGKAVL